MNFSNKLLQKLNVGKLTIKGINQMNIESKTLTIATTVLADNRANDELKEVPLIVTRIQKVYNNRANFTGLTTTLAIAQNAFPASRVVTATSVTNRWGGSINVVPVSLVTSNDAASITYTNMPKSECLAVLPQLDSSMRTMTVGGTSTKADGVPTDLAALGTQCGLAPTTVVYTFSK
jgi:hypothetical protein